MLRHGSVVRTTIFLASLDIQTAFDEAKPRHVAKMMESHNTRGWIVSALLREMSGSDGQAMFEWASFWTWKDKEHTRYASSVGRQLLGHVPLQKSPGTDAEGSDSGS